jgi:hypothetical protein
VLSAGPGASSTILNRAASALNRTPKAEQW